MRVDFCHDSGTPNIEKRKIRQLSQFCVAHKTKRSQLLWAPLAFVAEFYLMGRRLIGPSFRTRILGQIELFS
jgi:hypothetical protein